MATTGLVSALISAAVSGYQAYENKQARKKQASLAQDSLRAAQNQNTGDITKKEAKASASKRAFRTGLYYTSPTGDTKTGTRGRSRLFGS